VLVPYCVVRAPELLLVFAAGLRLYSVRSGFCAPVFSAAKASPIRDLTRIFVLCSGAVQNQRFLFSALDGVLAQWHNRALPCYTVLFGLAFLPVSSNLELGSLCRVNYVSLHLDSLCSNASDFFCSSA
jgi:hypothetical protein